MDVGYFDPNEPIGNLQGNLPHWRQEGVTYFVTFRLADSLPDKVLDLWQRERVDWLQRNPLPRTAAKQLEYRQRFVDRFHQWLDAGHGSCILADSILRQIVAYSLTHFEQVRYSLREWVIMPNHVHVIVTPLAGYKLSKIIQAWKSFTAKRINQQRELSGSLWFKESFDHIVRSPDQLERIERYIHDNPRGLARVLALGCIHQ